MILDELVHDVRVILDDLVTPPQFATADIVRRYNEAVSEACIRTRVLQDSSSKVTRITLAPDQSVYRLNPAIFAVRRTRIDGQHHPLELRDTSELDAIAPGWDDSALTPAGTPRYAVFDYGTGKLVLHPRPATAGTLHMLVWRGPTEAELLDADDPNGEPAIPQHMHRELKHWVAAQCYLNADEETRAPRLAAEQLALFEAAYGRKPDLHEIRSWSTNRRRRVVPSYD